MKLVTARADSDGITFHGWSGPLALTRTALGVIGGPIAQSADALDEAAADALLAQAGRPRTGPWTYDGACWNASVTRDRKPAMTPSHPKPSALADLIGPYVIRVRPLDTVRGIEGIREAAPRQVLTAIFRHPQTGDDLPVTITLFQGEDPRHMGVGVYVTDGEGEEVRGTVLRWDRGVDEDPRIIYWERAHCADDECGKPCSHRKRGRS